MTVRDDIWDDYAVRQQIERFNVSQMRESVDSTEALPKEMPILSKSGVEHAENAPSKGGDAKRW